MRFIGRQSELETLEREYQRDGGFVVVYGRRRVGKTTLIKEFIRNKNAFYFLATTEVESQSMKRFAGVLGRGMKNPMLTRATFHDWVDLFQTLADYQPEEKKVLVIDEFPYLVKTNAAFPSILQNVWDEFLKDSNVMLILCGSLIGMMQKYALSYDSPLYGRRTAQIRLMPLSFMDIYPLQNLPFEKAMEYYAVTGGVPKYLELFDETEELEPQLQSVVLSRTGFLYEEPNFLLREEVQTPVNYFSILKVIADGNHKLGAIAGVLELDTSALTPYLATLQGLGFVEKQVPITEKNIERSRKGLYFISDNFIRFWFRYVHPYTGELELDNTQIVLDEMQKDFVSKFIAFVYEDVCKTIFTKLCADKQIDFVPSRVGSYWLNDYQGDTQIDVAAVDNQNKRVFLGECKYHKQPVDADVYFDLKKKVESSSEIRNTYRGYEVVYGVFSKSGFSQRLLDIKEQSSNLVLVNEDRII